MKKLFFLTAIALFSQFSHSSLAHAELSSDEEIMLAEEAIESPTLNIEGKYKKEKELEKQEISSLLQTVEKPRRIVRTETLSPSQKLKLIRQRLEERNRIMIEKKMEQIRYQQELALARQLQRSMNQTLNSIDSIK